MQESRSQIEKSIIVEPLHNDHFGDRGKYKGSRYGADDRGVI